MCSASNRKTGRFWVLICQVSAGRIEALQPDRNLALVFLIDGHIHVTIDWNG